MVKAELEREFLDFVAYRGTAMFRTAYALTGDRHAAEDLIQTALARTALRWAKVHTSPEAYVRRVMYHECVTGWRRKHFAETPLTDDHAVPDHSDRTLIRMSLQKALRLLAPKQRAVIVLRFLEDLSERQVADIIGCSESTVGSQTSRALARLRELAPELRELFHQEATI
ncbi:SigE family RNA polymerase sigma factor [Fodinicola acaciae]|uniref:SigE family RNA polymerase sigma factor n=1 Tax=Fodinicola acaciae TaxID=2681555 RepID=UPI0013D72175|nr:SigE family RNA polymerase sigma factor [Fodinicola acaciae]